MKNILSFLIKTILLSLIFVVGELLIFHQINYIYIEVYLIVSVIINITSSLYKSQFKYYLSFAITFFVFISVLYPILSNINPLISNKSNFSNIKYLVAFYVGITNIFLILPLLFKGKFKVLSYLFQFILLLPTLIIWQYFFISNSFIGPDTILAILQTNFNEAKSYIFDFMGIKQYVGLAILLLLSFLLLKNINKIYHNNSKNFAILLVLSISFNFLLVYNYKINTVTNIVININTYFEEYRKFKEVADKRIFNDIKIDKSKDINKGVYVIVIGESQNKTHMSAYGYNKRTTPWLESMEQDKNFIKFTNVYSCHTLTAQVLPYALTSKNQYNTIPISDAVSVLDLAKILNFQTAWLSNQNRFCLYDNIVGVISDTAQQQKWMNKIFEERKMNKNFEERNQDNDTSSIFYDITLVDALKNIKLYDDMLIIVHLMGNHNHYKDRYPKEFNVFHNDKNTTIAEYDNSILYNDYVMENIFKTVKEIPNFKALIYFADHAESLDGISGHNPDKFVLDMTYVPMYIYFSDQYIKENNDIFNNLYKHKDYYFTNDLLFNLLLGILNIRITDIYEQNNDIVSENYDNNIKRFKTLYGEEAILDTISFLETNNVIPTNFKNKRKIDIPKNSIWLHETNSKKILISNFNNYAGFEIDINFNAEKECFNTNRHNIDDSENLADMLNKLNGLETKYLWLDFKNLSPANKNVTLEMINKIVKENKLKKEHIIIESKDATSLNIFSKAGYYTCLDLDCYSWKDISKMPNSLKENIKYLEQSSIDFVSSDLHFFDIVKYCFPNMPHLFWFTDNKKRSKYETNCIFENDKNLYVILN